MVDSEHHDIACRQIRTSVGIQHCTAAERHDNTAPPKGVLDCLTLPGTERRLAVGFEDLLNRPMLALDHGIRVDEPDAQRFGNATADARLSRPHGADQNERASGSHRR